MTDTPDDALIEAVMRAMGCRPGTATNRCPEGCSYCDGSECWEHDEAFGSNGLCPAAVKVAAAMVDHLGLTEERRPSEGNYSGMTTTGPGFTEVRVFSRYTEQRRLVSKWEEVEP